MLLTIPPIRASDNWGDGHYGASRGMRRKHKGIDYACYPGTTIKSIKYGQVTKLGFPYDDDEDGDGKPDFDYVEITDPAGNRARYFYVKPCVAAGDMIQSGQDIGVTQELGKKYKGITEHLHLEVIGHDGKHFDPAGYLIPMARP